jgi:cytochrome c biogenesis protein CcmG, thiol:disulfide interchange protein DsbE
MWMRIIGLVMLSAVCLPARPVKLKTLNIGSITYSNVVVLGANATDLYFTYDQGIANVKLRFLSPALQQEFHYNPVAASAAERRQLEDETRYQQNLAASMARAGRANSPSARTFPESLADPISDKSFLGKPAPELAVEKWLGEKPELGGKAVLVSFWAGWSVPCRRAIPELNAFQKKFADTLTVIGLSSEPMTNLDEAPGPEPQFPLGLDTKARLRTALGVTSLPCVVLLDPGHIVRYQGHPAALNEQALQKLLTKFAPENQASGAK